MLGVSGLFCCVVSLSGWLGRGGRGGGGGGCGVGGVGVVVGGLGGQGGGEGRVYWGERDREREREGGLGEIERWRGVRGEGGREGGGFTRMDGGVLGKDMYKRERGEREPNLCALRLRYLSGFL